MHAMLPLADQLPDTTGSWAPVMLLLIIGILFAITNVVASLLIGPSRTGPGKETTYESGMIPIGTTRQRFNVRFYVVAMIFLVFDVEIIFFYPFATIFGQFVRHSPAQGTVALISILIFIAVLLISYIYALGKGVFQWD